jgi:hypothetical protein
LREIERLFSGGDMKLYRSILLVSVAAYVGAPASAASITSAPGKSGSVVIEIQGQIGAGDADVFNQTVKRAVDSGKSIASVRLNSKGGKLDEGAKLAFAIKFGKLATVVASDAVCASACFLAFAAGDPKFAGPGALIGVHKASEKGGLETKASGAATAAMAGFARELGIPSHIISLMVKTPPTQIAWLEPRDLHSMAVRTTSNIALATASAGRTDEPEVRKPPTQVQTLAITRPAEKIENRPVWNEFVDKMMALSAEQNKGNAALTRVCKSDSRECAMAVAYLLKDGRQGLATVFQDADGNIKRREVCESNAANDARDCLNWDTGAKYRDVKNTKGEWEQSL